MEGSRDRREGSRVFLLSSRIGCSSDFQRVSLKVPEQEQSGAETFLLRQLRKNDFSVNTDVPEEEKEQQREV